MLRWRFPRFASILPAFALSLALTACGAPRIVPAPVMSPQSPSVGPTSPLPSPVAPVTAEPLGQPPTAGPVKVGLLVPMSGPNTELGKAMLEAAQLALFTTGGDRLTLIPRDTGGTPEGAAPHVVPLTIGVEPAGGGALLAPLTPTELAPSAPALRGARAAAGASPLARLSVSGTCGPAPKRPSAPMFDIEPPAPAPPPLHVPTCASALPAANAAAKTIAFFIIDSFAKAAPTLPA